MANINTPLGGKYQSACQPAQQPKEQPATAPPTIREMLNRAYWNLGSILPSLDQLNYTLYPIPVSDSAIEDREFSDVESVASALVDRSAMLAAYLNEIKRGL